MSTAAERIDRGFAARLGALLHDTRRARGQTLGSLARQSSLSRQQLKDLELGRADLDDELIGEVTALYEADLGNLMNPRRAIEIDIAGTLRVGVAHRSFDPLDDTSLLMAYLSLVRQLRHQEREPVLALRREDIEALAQFLCLPGEQIVEQLANLMGLTQHRRRSMVAMFAAGASVVGLVSVTAALSGSAEPGITSSVATPVATQSLPTAPPPPAAPVEVTPAEPAAPAPAAASVTTLPAPSATVRSATALPAPAGAPVAFAAPLTTAVEDPNDEPPPESVPVAEPEPGREVAVGSPPLPPFPAFDGDREVAVGPPPLPPVHVELPDVEVTTPDAELSS